MTNHIKSLIGFITHIITGAIIFSAIALVACGIDVLMIFLAGHGASEFTQDVLGFASALAMVFDVTLMLCYFVISSWRFLSKIRRNGE